MNHRHRKVLGALFARPASANIHTKDAEAVLADLGATLDHTSHGRLQIALGGRTMTMAHVGHTLSPETVRELRKFLESAGVSPPAGA